MHEVLESRHPNDLRYKVYEILTLLEYKKDCDRWKAENRLGEIGLISTEGFRRLYPVSNYKSLKNA